MSLKTKTKGNNNNKICVRNKVESLFTFFLIYFFADNVLNKNKRRSFPLEYKLMIVEEAKKTNNRYTSRNHFIDESVIRKWRKDETKMRESLDQGKVRFRMDAVGRSTGSSKMSESNISVDQSQNQQIGFQIPPSYNIHSHPSE